MIHVYEVCDNLPTYICLQGELANKFEDFLKRKILEADIVNELYTPLFYCENLEWWIPDVRNCFWD